MEKDPIVEDIDKNLERLANASKRKERIQYYLDLGKVLSTLIPKEYEEQFRIDIAKLEICKQSIEEEKEVYKESIERLKAISSREETISQQTLEEAKAKLKSTQEELLRLRKQREERESALVQTLIQQGYPKEISMVAIDFPEITSFFNFEYLRHIYGVAQSVPYEPKSGRLELVFGEEKYNIKE